MILRFRAPGRQVILAILLFAGWSEEHLAAEEATAAPVMPRLRASLTDRSTIIGIPTPAVFTLQTAYVTLEIPLAQIQTVRLATTPADMLVTLTNGDRLTGTFGPRTIDLATLGGRVKVDLRLVTELTVIPGHPPLPDLDGILRKGLLLRYSCAKEGGNGRIPDDSDDHHDGVVEGARWEPAERFGGCYVFDGRSSLIRAPEIDLTHGSFTLAAWARRAEVENGEMITQGRPETDKGLQFGFGRHPQQEVVFGFYYDDLESPDGSAQPLDEWHFWAGTYDASSRERKLYRDGVLVAQDTAAAPYRGSGDIDIGTATWHEDWQNDLFRGSMADIMIFSRALAADEVRTLAAAHN